MTRHSMLCQCKAAVLAGVLESCRDPVVRAGLSRVCTLAGTTFFNNNSSARKSKQPLGGEPMRADGKQLIRPQIKTAIGTIEFSLLIKTQYPDPDGATRIVTVPPETATQVPVATPTHRARGCGTRRQRTQTGNADSMP